MNQIGSIKLPNPDSKQEVRIHTRIKTRDSKQ